MASGTISKTVGEDGYCKLEDGTLLQWGTLVVSNGNTVSTTFPIAFIAEPSMFLSWVGGNNASIAGEVTAASETAFSITSYATKYFKWFALGRWT